MHMWHGYSFWNSFVIIVFWIVFIVFIVLTVYLVKQIRKMKENKNNNALSILKERLARGEIDEAEYRRLNDILEED